MRNATSGGIRLPVLVSWVSRATQDHSKRSQLAALMWRFEGGSAFSGASPRDIALLSDGISPLLETKYQQSARRLIRLLAKEIVCQPLARPEWQQQALALVIGGLGKAMGRDVNPILIDLGISLAGLSGHGMGRAVNPALQALAQEVARRDLGQWSAPHLAMVADGLSKAEGDEITAAMDTLAGEIAIRPLNDWTEQDLAMVVNGMSKAGGDNITRALEAVAQDVVNRDLGPWTDQSLTTVAEGLGKVESSVVTRCLQRLAWETTGRDLSQWPPAQLAIMAHSISTAESRETSKALELLAREMIGRDLNQWTIKHLCMMLTGIRAAKARSKDEIITTALEVLTDVSTRRARELGCTIRILEPTARCS